MSDEISDEIFQRKKALELLSVQPSRQALITLISWLDWEYCTRWESSSVSLPMQILARAVIAIGYELLQKRDGETIRRTIQAAEEFALEPQMDRYEIFQNAATNSYPFGPGDGCYAVPTEKYSGCEPGSGCISGAGCLFHTAPVLNEEEVLQVIARELVPWLHGKADPVLVRLNRL